MADAAPPPPQKSNTRRDALLALEETVQKEWAKEGTFEADAAEDGRPKFFVTFPYPYMNGRLHLGHAFSLTKAEFAAGYKRLTGHNVLFPFGFHCTGMPIQAAANKLKAEVAKYGNPPVFPSEAAPEPPKGGDVETLEKQMAQLAKKGKAKKAKVGQKGAGTSYQWQALEKMGIPSQDIAAFAEPKRWLDYFPPHGVNDLKTFGASVDWRRSFVTTDQNPYYDSFVRWQFLKLRAADKIAYGKRANVYAVADAQCCADHDRASGEGVGPQEYTLIKLKVVAPYPPCLAACAGSDVFLVPATLRPETMYGQTNCYVLPDGDYGAFRQANGDVFVTSKRAAVGLAHQGAFTPVENGPDDFSGYAETWGEADLVGAMFKGADLLGCPLKAPLAKYDVVYTLPLTTISMTKGTGVVTSVPSDAPDDWIALHELKNDPKLRETWGLEEKHVAFDVVPIINITVGASGEGKAKKEAWASDVSAEYWCEKLDIKSQKDAAKLKVAKGETYLNGFNYGVMLVGPHAGAKVADAKPVVKGELVASGDALLYFEPESPIISRSGEECIVAHTEQWYLKYGEASWRDAVTAHVDSAFEAYNAECLARFKYTLGWMKEWACSRLFGLGTKIPWDEGWLIESLSDSTIYMAYYAVANTLQGDGSNNLDGRSRSTTISPKAMTPAVWDYVYLDDAKHPSEIDGACGVPDALLEKMRAEFRYWYPMDLRVSGKDLIGNHLTMCLYNHAAIWPTQAATRWPRSMYTNGFVLLDGEKMSKSTGNFLMLDEACKLYSADAVRFALADAGDSLEDANFERKRADGAVTMLFVEAEFARRVVNHESVPAKDRLATRASSSPRDAYFVDRAFSNELVALIDETRSCYEAMRWRDGIQAGAFGLQLARDAYRDWCARSDVPMHAGLLKDYCAAAAILLAPVCPHFGHHVWRDVLGETKPMAWPAPGVVDKALQRSYGFLRGTARSLRLDAAKELKALKGKAPAGGYVYVAGTYPPWRKAVLARARACCAANGGQLVEKKALLGALKGDPAFGKEGEFAKQAKLAMQFGSFQYDYAAEVGLGAFDDVLPFSQVDVLNESKLYFSKCIFSGSVLDITIVDLDATDSPPGPEKKYAQASPGKVTMHLFAAAA
mmetsp:Transcript_23198/g.69557  ORF Transcript_23198/g.69557 Transcript_23198/m.69557 type:complete len:1127 (-) Transcript_23198:68-3448(-)